VRDTREQHLVARANNTLFRAAVLGTGRRHARSFTLIMLFFHQLIAFLIYLASNNFGLQRMRAVAWWKRSHFYFGGDGPKTRPGHFREIAVSDLGIAVIVWGLWMAGREWGWGECVVLL